MTRTYVFKGTEPYNIYEAITIAHEGDNNATELNFDFDRYGGGVDLSSFICYAMMSGTMFETGSDIAQVTVTDVTESRIRCKWLVSGANLQVGEGNLQFKFVGENDEAWQTDFIQIAVEKSLVDIEPSVVAFAPTIIGQMVTQLDILLEREQVSAEILENAKSYADEKSEDALNTATAYTDTKLIEGKGYIDEQIASVSGGVSPSIRLGTSTAQAVSQKFFTDTLGGLYTVSGNTAIALSQVIGTDFNDIYINRSDLLPMFIELTDGGQQAFVITKTPSDYTFYIVAYNYLATDGAVCAVLKLLAAFDSEEVATLPLYVERTCDVIINQTTGATESVTAGWHTAVDANGKFSIGQTGIGLESLNGYTVNQLMTNQNNILSSTQFTVTINTVKSYVDGIVGDIETLLAGV